MPFPPPSAPPTDLTGRAILITGATGGLGRPLALACASRGATVVLHGRVVRKLEALYDEIVAGGPSAADDPAARPRDCGPDDYGNVAAAIRAQLGRLDGIVHTAAVLGSLGPIEHQAFDAWLKVLRVNVAAAMALTRAARRCSPRRRMPASCSRSTRAGRRRAPTGAPMLRQRRGLPRSRRRSPTNGKAARTCASTRSSRGRSTRRCARRRIRARSALRCPDPAALAPLYL